MFWSFEHAARIHMATQQISINSAKKKRVGGVELRYVVQCIAELLMTKSRDDYSHH